MTEGFNSQAECEAARLSYNSSLNKYLAVEFVISILRRDNYLFGAM